MAVTAEHIAIAELVIYIPVTLLTIVVVLRHGFHKQLGWIYLSIFGVIRIAGAIMEVLSTNNPDDTNNKEWAVILQSVGLSPLLLSTLGLLKRIFDETTRHLPSDPNSKTNIIIEGLSLLPGIIGKIISIFSKRATAISRRSKVVQLLHLPALIALILAISGGSDQASSNVSEHAGGKKETQAAIIIFLLIYVTTCLLFVITVRDLREMLPSQKRIYICVFFALPLIAVRLLYSLISDFGHDAKFSLIDGDSSVQLAMATIEEFLVVLMYTMLGVVTPQSSIERAIGGGIVAPEIHPLEDGRSDRHVSFAQPGARSAYYAK
ncbi:hypothetical protein N7493_001908 [Penicillium malachiteum]|uniref:DUF7702 domain-containing protein n=1 Tax=Penicillium malachiteum TaxID=1324776 RepID=A0AAD6N0D8_9EURO|nr:hypothetical protein N7493_001908 [Penicillium malachiteum]